MMLHKAQVTSNTDFLKKGRFLAHCKSISNNEFWVTYVSPYKADFRGGFVAVPDVGSEVLIAATTSEQDKYAVNWYYMGSVYGDRDSDLDTTGELVQEYTRHELPDKEIYKAKDSPDRLLLQDKSGNKVLLSNSSNPEYMSKKAEVQSSLGKTLSLDDGKSDSSMLLNEHGDGIKISSGRTALRGARSIELECPGSQKIISKFSDIELTVVDGREIDIVNASTGDKRDSDDKDSTGHAGKYGNINISSEHNDINLTVYKQDGKVFIDSLGTEGLIQLDSAGDITIWSDKNVNIKSGSNMNFKAEGNINLDAGGSIDINSGERIRVSSDKEIDVKTTGGNVNVDGRQVHLASDKSTKASKIQNLTKISNNYDN